MPESRPFPVFWRRLLQATALICLAALTSGCAKMVYDRLDTVAGWYIGKLVTLEPQQQESLRDWLARTHEWHRASEMRRYSAFLRELAANSDAPLDRAGIEAVGRQVETFGKTLVARAAPEAARLLLTLTPTQAAQLDANLDKRGRERTRDAQKALEKGKWSTERARDFKRQLQRWTGSVTKEQRALLEHAATQIEPTSREWLESQRRWRQALVETIDAQPPDAEARILALLREPDAYWTDEYIAKNERNRERSIETMAALDATLTPQQREHLKAELLELAEKIDGLAGPESEGDKELGESQSSAPSQS